MVVGASLTSRINVGVLAVALAWPIGLYAAGWKADALMATFPSSLFLTLLGVTLLFGVAQANGTMAAITAWAVRRCHGRVALLPFVFFLLACVISTCGPGAIATTALLAPLAMGVASRAGVPVLLTALMVGNGANAGNLSPISPVGVLVHSLMEPAGLGGHPVAVWGANFVAHVVAGIIAWSLFGGIALLRSRRVVDMSALAAATDTDGTAATWTRTHGLTIAVCVVWIGAVLLFKVHPGLSAFAAASVLVLLRAGDDAAMLRSVPWTVITMVCGVSVLVGVLDKTGGMDLFTTMLAAISSPATVNGTVAFVAGLLSTYSSTSGVVYPAFLPAVPGLAAKLGGGDLLGIALSVNVGAAIVDVSPLSTIGALCIAAVPAAADPKALFRSLLLWGFAMTVMGALFCQLFIGFFR